MSLLSAHNLHKGFGPHTVLDGVSLSIEEGDRLGLVGDNGSGKSTLARILGGGEPADQGEVMRRRGARIGALAQVPEHDPNQSAFDVVAQGLSAWRAARAYHDSLSQKLARASAAETERLLAEQAEASASIERLGGWEQEHKIRALLEHLTVPDPSARVGQLSGGEQRRVALARELVAQPDLLILDEPTNHLDTETSDWLEQYLQSEFKGALLLITHDRYFLDRLVTRTLELSKGTITSYDGGWQEYLQGKAERQTQQERTEANRQNFLRKEIDWLRRQPKARGTKQKARTERAEAALDNRPDQVRSGVQLSLSSDRQGSSILEFRGVELRVGERTLVRNLDLILKRQQRVGIIGHNGVGKTSLLRAVMSQLEPHSGELVFGKNTKIAYFDQERASLDENKTIAENVSDSPKVQYGEQELTLYSYLARFMFYSQEIHKKVSMLSGGERARVALAKLLLERCNLLLLDEPTNDLDVTTLSSLEDMLLSFGGSVLVVTHDRYFLNRVATDILSFEGDGQVVHYVGNYDTYKELRPARPSKKRDDAAETRDVGDSGASKSSRPRPVKLSYNEQRELDGMMEAIDNLEQRVGELEQLLSEPELYKGDLPKAQSLQDELERTRGELEAKVARWEQLESKKEAFEASR